VLSIFVSGTLARISTQSGANIYRIGVLEVFYREAKGWLGLKEYQVRQKRSLLRHFILVFVAYTFILWYKLTGGLRRRWGNKPLKTFPEALEAFRTATLIVFTTGYRIILTYSLDIKLVWAIFGLEIS
jgi:hypothetical protein